MGAGGAAVGEGLKAAAPMLTGIAQGLHPEDYGKTGKAILGETKGVFPGQIRGSAQGVLDKLNPELNRVANESPANITMQSARDAASEQIGRAATQNQPKLTKGITRMGNQLMARDFTPALGAEGPSGTIPISNEVPAREYLELKRGIGKALPAGSWSPESSNAFKGPRNSIYGTMAKEFENAVPEAAPLNSRISSLIPATEKPQNIFWGHTLGPGVGALYGGLRGARSDGWQGAAQGAAEGAAAGLLFPAALNTVARGANSPALQRVIMPSLVGGALQTTRKKKE